MANCVFESYEKMVTIDRVREGVFEDNTFVYLVLDGKWFMNAKANFTGNSASEPGWESTGFISCTRTPDPCGLRPLKSLTFSNG